ncbi:MAG: ferritin-like domain-containing protein [Streptosporangiaceae bacterium]
MGPEPTRRLVLSAAAAAGALGLAGCKGLEVLGHRPAPGADVITLEHAIAAEELLLARYHAALTTLTAGHASRVVAAVAAQHQAHLDRLRARLELPPRLRTARPKPSPRVAPPAGGRPAILAGLARAEAQASARLATELTTVAAALAQLMASIGAAEAAHLVLLGHGKDVPPPAALTPASAVHGARAQTGRDIAAMQTALAAEQAASYGYGVAGAHLTGAKYLAAAADCVAHERARDNLTAMITALGGRPRPAAIAYRLPDRVRTARQAAALAVTLEHDVTAAYLGLVAAAAPGLRTVAADGMRSCAVRATRWSSRSPAFPGLPRGR